MAIKKFKLLEVTVAPVKRSGFTYLPVFKCIEKVAVPKEQRGRNKRLVKACNNGARIMIEGKPMCVRHAQQFSLNFLLLRTDARDNN